MNEADQKKIEVLGRLKKVFESTGISSRAFSKSIGLKPTSFHKVLTGAAGLTTPLANSIELNHGYRSDWLLSGKGNMKVNKNNHLSPLERCFLEVSRSSIQKWHLLEILIIEKITNKISDQFWGNLRNESNLESGDERRKIAYKNLEKISELFRELREEEKACLECQDQIGQKIFAHLTQALLLASYYGKEWDNLKIHSEEYNALQSDGNINDFEKLLAYINNLMSVIDS